MNKNAGSLSRACSAEDRHQLRYGGELREFQGGPRRGDHASHHFGERRLRIPWGRPRHDGADGRAREGPRGGSGGAPSPPRLDGVRAEGDEDHTGGGERLPTLPDGGPEGVPGYARYEAAAREAARGVLLSPEEGGGAGAGGLGSDSRHGQEPLLVHARPE